MPLEFRVAQKRLQMAQNYGNYPAYVARRVLRSLRQVRDGVAGF